MAALESLPPDQRAVLQLILRQGRSYDDLAGLLKISPDAVQARAHAGMTALAGEALPDETRGLVTDYLLGQLGVSERARARSELGGSEPARAWAREAEAALGPLGGDALPEIPEPEPAPEEPAPAPPAPRRRGRGRRAAEEPVAEQTASVAPSPDQPAPSTAPVAAEPVAAGAAAEERPPRAAGDPAPSRLGGIALLAGVAILAVAIVLALVLPRGGSDSASTGTTPVGTTPTTTTPTSTSPAGNAGGQVVAQINLNPPGGGSSPVGIARLARAKNAAAFLVAAQGIQKPASGSFVGVWLTGSGTKPIELVGVAANRIVKGQLATPAPVPRNLAPYSTMLITLQTGDPTKPATTPGRTLLSGKLPANAK